LRRRARPGQGRGASGFFKPQKEQREVRAEAPEQIGWGRAGVACETPHPFGSLATHEGPIAFRRRLAAGLALFEDEEAISA